jgi:hypothetical protein
MKITVRTTIFKQTARSGCVMLLCAALIWPGMMIFAQTPPQVPEQQAATKIPPEQLAALVAPVALYPDSLLAQVLVASTYPLELIQLYQWLQKNPDLQKDQKKLQEKVMKQPWDPSIQSMAALPDTVKWLAEDIQWTTDLGNAFLAQEQDVMNAIQRMRVKAQQKGALKSGEQMQVQTQVVESKEVIVIQQSDPEVVYVPQYNPVVVYGDPYPMYPYPPIYYPAGGYVAAGLIGFGIGMAIGHWNGGNWGWGCGWGGGDININRNNNFNRNTNISGGNRINNVQGGNKWQHNATHRAGAPYGDRGTADRFGGTTRGDSLANRQGAAQRDLGNRGRQTDFGNRGATGDNRGGFANNRDNRGGIADNRGGRTDSRGGISDNRGNMGGRSSNQVGSRDLSPSSRGGDRGLGGGSNGFDRSSTRSSSSRGMSSMSSSRGSFGGSGGRSFGGAGGGRSFGGGGRRR